MVIEQVTQRQSTTRETIVNRIAIRTTSSVLAVAATYCALNGIAALVSAESSGPLIRVELAPVEVSASAPDSLPVAASLASRS